MFVSSILIDIMVGFSEKEALPFAELLDARVIINVQPLTTLPPVCRLLSVLLM